MEPITEIQELVDQHREEMPMALMQKCQEAYDTQPKLYKLTWTMVDSHAHIVVVEDEPDFARVELSHKTQTLIVEAVDGLPNHPNGHGGKLSTMEMPHYGMVVKSWLQMLKPTVMMDNSTFGRKDYMVIIHSIEPYTPKRSRE
jgi:hypothetical protein